MRGTKEKSKIGPDPKRKVEIKWSSNFAYAIGLLATDGCLSGDCRHITFVSKDLEQIKNFQRCLNFKAKLGKTTSGNKRSLSYRVQFSDVVFYRYLESIGLFPAKSKILGNIAIPEEYFFDFLRGSFDGDGCFYSYWDKRWRSSHMFYIEFVSASKKHIDWLQDKLSQSLKVKGHITKDGRKITYQLKYAKREGLEIINRMYYSKNVVCLSRKLNKIRNGLGTEKRQQKIYNSVK